MALLVVRHSRSAFPASPPPAHLGLLALASLVLPRAPARGPRGRIRFLVLVPAHNEAPVIGRCLEAIDADAGPGDQVLVVADRCTDATAAIARRFGASVLERGPEDEPGRAAARQAGLEHARALEWDAVVMLDADSVIAPGFFDACERALAGRAPTRSRRAARASAGRTLATEASLAAFALQGITLPRGRDRLGLSARLRGTGMAIRRQLALAHRFRAPASEDLVFTLDLLLDGRPLPARRRRAAALGGRQHAGARSAARRSATRPGGWPRRARTCRGCCAARGASPRPRLSRGGVVPGHAAVRARRALAARGARARRRWPRPGPWRRSSEPACSRSPRSSSPA